MYKDILVLADSIKHQGHCIAGKDIQTKEWVRPVSSESGGELTDEQVQYKNNHGKFSVKELEIVRFYYKKHCPSGHQTENYLVDDDQIWEQTEWPKQTIEKKYIDEPDNLWGEGYCVSSSNAIKLQKSLYLVNVKNLELYKRNRRQWKQIPQRRVKFQYNNIDYDFAATVREFDNICNTGLKYESACLCISLGENYEDHCYKLVVGIFI